MKYTIRGTPVTKKNSSRIILVHRAAEPRTEIEITEEQI